MVELVARIATPTDEAAWPEEARRATVRQMRKRIAEGKPVSSESDEMPRPRVTIVTTVDKIDAWAFDEARVMVESVGARTGDEAIEAMLAEGLREVVARFPEVR